MTQDFVSLHTHSDNSILDGFGTVDEYVQRAVDLGQPGIGLTDHGTMYGVFHLIEASRRAGILPVPGQEFYIAPENPQGARVDHPVYYGDGGPNDVSGRGSYLHMTVWAVNNTGLHNLYKLSTMSFHPDNRYKKNRIDFAMLAEHSDGLVVATGCPSSEISTRFRLGQDKEAYEYASRLKDVFGPERLYVEIMDHNMSIDLERNLLTKQMKLAHDLKLPLLATNDSHYTHPHDATHHEEMLAMQTGQYMSEPPTSRGGKRFAFDGDQYYVKSYEEMARIFPERDFPSALSNSVAIAEMAQDISLDYDPNLRPQPAIPQGMTEVQYFHHLISEGARERFANYSPQYRHDVMKRLKRESEVIVSSDYVGYFLTTREYIKWAQENFSTRDKDNNIVALSTGVGRGSVGGSMIAFCLGISEIDPLRHDLMFERFLSEGRGNIYEITYDDGTTENIVVSSTKKVMDAQGNVSHKYIYQLNDGDVVVDDDPTTDNDDDTVTNTETTDGHTESTNEVKNV